MLNPNPTEQEVFDFVSAHLFKQGKPAKDDETGLCEYRNSEGLCCAVGILIPQDDYKEDMEGIGLEELTNTFGDLLPSYFSKFRNTLNALQQTHDEDTS